MDNFDEFYSPKIKRANIAGCRQIERFGLVEGDIRDAECVSSLLGKEDIDIIVRLAAKA